MHDGLPPLQAMLPSYVGTESEVKSLPFQSTSYQKQCIQFDSVGQHVSPNWYYAMGM